MEAVTNLAHLVGQDLRASRHHLWCVGELLAVENENILVIMDGMLGVRALGLGRIDTGCRCHETL